MTTPITKGLPKVEACIEWAMQNGYYKAGEAAVEYGRKYSRELVDDENTGMYNTHSWRDMARIIIK